MPFTRPAEISNGVSLSDKVAGAVSVRRFVSEDGAIDSCLSAVVDKFSPDKHGVSVSSSKNNVFAGTDELASFASVLVLIGAVVSLIEFQATLVAVLRDVPKLFHFSVNSLSPLTADAHADDSDDCPKAENCSRND